MISMFNDINLGFMVPHTLENQGRVATVSRDQVTEHQYAQAMLFKVNAPYSWREKDFSDYPRALRNLKFLGINAVVETQFNVFNEYARGFEFLVLEGDCFSEEFAKMLVKKFKQVFPSREPRHCDGIKYVCPLDRGYKELKIMQKCGMRIALISELFFGDNPYDYISILHQADFWAGIIDDLATVEGSRKQG